MGAELSRLTRMNQRQQVEASTTRFKGMTLPVLPWLDTKVRYGGLFAKPQWRNKLLQRNITQCDQGVCAGGEELFHYFLNPRFRRKPTWDWRNRCRWQAESEGSRGRSYAILGR